MRHDRERCSATRSRLGAERPVGRLTTLATLLFAGVLSTAVMADPFEPPQKFLVRGWGAVSARGESIPGGLRGELVVLRGGRVRLSWLRIEMVDFSVTSGPFWDRDTAHFRCSRAISQGSIDGTLDPTGRLVFPAGSARVVGGAYAERGPAGGCPGRGPFTRITATNNADLVGWHDPALGLFRLGGRFSTSVGGETLTVDISTEGEYLNRPPVAALAVVEPGAEDPELARLLRRELARPPVAYFPRALGQGGCPPFTGVNPPSVEANDPAGLRAMLYSNSRDPDGEWATSDLALVQWRHWRGGMPYAPAATYRFLGRGRAIGPVLFELDQPHALVLSVTDRQGAKDATGCGFWVKDTTPPVITPPAPLTLVCTIPGGATPATSPELREFLAAGSAADVTDPAPVRLTPQVSGVDVTESTLFPLGATTPVLFRFTDRHGNYGSQGSWVRVNARLDLAVDLGVGLDLPLPSPYGWIWVRPRLRWNRGSCGFAGWYLREIRSDGPEPIQSLVKGAVFGKGQEVPDFELLAAPVQEKGQAPRDRTYELVFVALDLTGEETVLVEKLVIPADSAEKKQ